MDTKLSQKLHSNECSHEQHDGDHSGHKHVHEHGKDHIPTDKMGMLLSFVCLVHCLLGPIVLIVVPGLSGSFGHELFHWVMLLFVIPVAAFSFVKSYQSHKIKFPLQLGSLGILFLLIGVLAPEYFGHDFLHSHDTHHDHGANEALNMDTFETAFSVLGGIFLAYAHYFNLKQCQCKD